MTKYKWPPEADIKSMRKKLSKGTASKTMPPNSSDLDKLKYKLCSIFVVYKRDNDISQKELALRIGIDEAAMSKILHYHIERFTVDRLIKYLAKIHRLDFSIKIA